MPPLVRRALIALVGTVWLAGAVPAAAATFTVDRADDDAGATACSDTGASDCSLRGAVIRANAASDADTINLPAGTYTLTIPEDVSQETRTGDLDVTDTLTITGAGAATTVVMGPSHVLTGPVARVRGLKAGPLSDLPRSRLVVD